MGYLPLQPATVEHLADGTPFSAVYADVYHSSSGGNEQAEHVFLRGNGLPSRWQGRESFTILETGFGLGLNFLATWSSWAADPQACHRLHYVSCEKHPFRAADLAQLLSAWPQFAPLATELIAVWPVLTPGFHRLELAGGRVVLTLLFGDARDWLPELVIQADALYLDGFSPARNPDLWSAELFQILAGCCRPGTTLATWSVAGHVRQALTDAGFRVSKTTGFARKRQMLTGEYAPQEHVGAQTTHRSRHAIVIGAGLAGCSIAERLAARGWLVDVIEQASSPAQGASGNHAGVLRPQPSLDDNVLSQLSRHGFLYARRQLGVLAATAPADAPVRWHACGALHLGKDERHAQRQQHVVAVHQPPAEYLQYVDAEHASQLAGQPVPIGGWWFPQGGWVQPPSVCQASLRRWPERIRLITNQSALALVRSPHGSWQVQGENGALLGEADVVVLACGAGITRFSQTQALPVVPARGQVTHLHVPAFAAPDVVVCRQGYTSPAVQGMACAGATLQMNDLETCIRAEDHRENLSKLQRMLPESGCAVWLDQPDESLAALPGRVGFRPTTPDRLPVVGALEEHIGLHVLSGFGARGLVWGQLLAETLASVLSGDPLPLPRSLYHALDPQRFATRRQGRGQSPMQGASG